MNGEKNSPAIVIAVYNRDYALRRLLENLEKAIYPDTPVPLVISIDKSENESVHKTALDFHWSHGEKSIIRHERHLGLKQHILSCGDLTQHYGSIILFEDDIYASGYFYDYAVQALRFYAGDARIAGISLYGYDIAENGFGPFAAIDDGYDVYFMQVASSWGQAWTKAQWQSFRKWLEENPEVKREEFLPAYLSNWTEYSWKKHFVRYLHASNKFFVFPHRSFTTNFDDPGATASRKGLFQVPIAEGGNGYKFSELDDSKSVYDANFEMRADCLKKWCPFLNPFDFTVDLYGTVPLADCTTPHLLTVKEAKDEIFAFSMEMFPPLLNVINNLRGEQIKLVKKENILSEKVSADISYYKYKPVSEIIFQEELVQRVEKVYANYSHKIDALHKSYTEKLERLHSQIRILDENYHRQISSLHEEYALKMKSAVDAALKDYQFKLDYPQFALVTIVKRENFESAVPTVQSVQQQDYPRISHRVIVIGDALGLKLPESTGTKLSFQFSNNITEAIELAGLHYNHHESDYHCWLEPGTILLPKALMTVRDIFTRFAEVNWIKGLPVKLDGEGKYIPFINGVDFRWDKNRFHESTLPEIGNLFSRCGILWKKHLWQKAGGGFNRQLPHVSDVEVFSKMFSCDYLYVVISYLTASRFDYIPSENARQEFNELKKVFQKRNTMQKLLSAAFYPFFKRDIPLLRAIHKSRNDYPPLIRFDYNSQSFYLSPY
ncbi:MAG TPA: hypothetical protein VNJ07_06005 [Chitinophagales bacterium]|nr:hypothetical protein [Chitinophagales bacterium]